MSSMTAAELRERLTSEDEVGHGEAYEPSRGGLGVCAYCDGEWPCRTQRGIDKLLALLPESGVFVTEEELAGALNNPVMRRFVTGSRETRTLLAAAILRELTR